jgi:hypothetical protein
MIAETINKAARNPGTRRCCSQSIGRTVINARKTAIKNGTNKRLAICIPKIITTTAAMLTTVLPLFGVIAVIG